MSLITCGSIHQGHEWFSYDSRGRRDFYVFGCSIMWAILPIREWRYGAKISIKSYFMRSFFCLSVFSSSEVLGKITSIRSNRLGKKREETVKPTCFMSKSTSVPQTPQTNHSQYSSPVEPLNLIVDSKSRPVELDNSTIELHVPSRRKKSLQSYCSLDFDFLAYAIWCDLWCHVAWRLKFR